MLNRDVYKGQTVNIFSSLSHVVSISLLQLLNLPIVNESRLERYLSEWEWPDLALRA